MLSPRRLSHAVMVFVRALISGAVGMSAQEGPTAGTVNEAGEYTAPCGSGAHHLIATSNADPSQSGAATATGVGLRIYRLAGGFRHCAGAPQSVPYSVSATPSSNRT